MKLSITSAEVIRVEQKLNIYNFVINFFRTLNCFINSIEETNGLEIHNNDRYVQTSRRGIEFSGGLQSVNRDSEAMV